MLFKFGIWSLVFQLFAMQSWSEIIENSKTCVILVHGFEGSTKDMSSVQEALTQKGYKTVNQDYDSRDGNIEALGKYVYSNAIKSCKDAKAIDIVTHSMGGLLLRSYLDQNKIPNLRRVVMLAPPNRGSEVADEVTKIEAFRDIFGPSLSDLKTVQDIPIKKGNFELGVIAGTASVNPITSRLLPGVDDGYVSLPSTYIHGMDDFISIPTSHGFITKNESAIEQTLHFLDTGKFDHNKPSTGYILSTNDFRELQRFLKKLDFNNTND